MKYQRGIFGLSLGQGIVYAVAAIAVVSFLTGVYFAIYNKGKAAAENVAITNPIPKETAYVDGSAVVENTAVTYSVDGGKRFDIPANLVDTGSDGKKRPATADDFTHIRWLLKSVAADGRGNVSFHAKVR